MNEHVQEMLEERLQLLSERSHEKNIGLDELVILSTTMASLAKAIPQELSSK